MQAPCLSLRLQYSQQAIYYPVFLFVFHPTKNIMKIKSSVVFPLLLVLALAFASVVFTKADLEFLDVENPRDPEQKYKECLQRCERRHKGQSFQERCHEDCKERRRQGEERRAHEQERGGDRGREEEQRREEERAREEEQRKEHERGGGREREEQRQEEERRREHEKGSGRGREEQQREEERMKEERGGGKGREEQRQQEERAREEEEKARQEEEQREHERGGRGRHEEQQLQEERKKSERDSKKQYKECLSQCGRQSQGRSSQEDCKRQCEEKWRRGGRQDINENVREREQEEKEFEQQGETSPYVFEDRHFSTIIQTQQGRERVLPRFTERSKLLKGIDNYRVLILEAEPQTFVLPNHYDADTVCFVAQGRGTVSLVRQNKRESFNIRRGDVAVVPAGTTAYVINRSNNERLIVAKLVRPVNTPGRFEPFFGAGGEEPESFYRAFSKEILEAAFNTKREKIEKVFGQQRQGAIVKASEEQIRGLSRHEEGGIWPFGGGESKGTVNIFQQRPLKSNQYGQLYEVDGSNLHQLQDLNVAVSVANISEGSMSTLLYNSRATKIAIVVNGEGYLEMACPHLSQSQEGRQGSRQGQQEHRRGGSQMEESKGSPSYQKVSARLRRGVVVVIPAGHPHVAVASENQNLEMVSFAINANNNERVPLAGRSNVINQLERNAKELAFGVPAKEVEEVFSNQDEEFFFKGPSQRQHRGQHESRADA